MRVAIVTPTFPQPRSGWYPGIERLARLLVDGLIDRGLDPFVVTTYWNGGGPLDSYRGATIIRVADASNYVGRLAYVCAATHWSWGLAVARALRRGGRPDVVHTLSPLSTTASLVKSGIPVVATFHHHSGIASIQDLLHRPSHWILEFATYLPATVVITPSQASARILHNLFGLSEDRIRVTPWGVSPDQFKRGQAHAGDGTRLLFVGIHEPRKGLEYLVKAVALLRSEGLPVQLTTVGRGPQLPQLKELANRLGLSGAVEFKGYLSDSDGSKLPDLWEQADIFILPSLQEGFGFVLVEAMANGIPVVATDISGIREVLGDAGILVPPRDPHELATALRVLILDAEKRRELGERGRCRVRDFFTWEKNLSRIISVYRDAIETVGTARV